MKNPKWREAYPQGHKVKYGGKHLTTDTNWKVLHINFNEGRITHRCSTDTTSKGLKKPDGHYERKSWNYSLMSGNTVLYTSSYQNYFSLYHRDVKNMRVLYDINNGN